MILKTLKSSREQNGPPREESSIGWELQIKRPYHACSSQFPPPNQILKKGRARGGTNVPLLTWVEGTNVPFPE